jgi:hypothetical protein
MTIINDQLVLNIPHFKFKRFTNIYLMILVIAFTLAESASTYNYCGANLVAPSVDTEGLELLLLQGSLILFFPHPLRYLSTWRSNTRKLSCLNERPQSSCLELQLRTIRNSRVVFRRMDVIRSFSFV